MLIAILTVATLLIIAWTLLLMRANDDDCKQASETAIFDNIAAVNKLTAKVNTQSRKLSAHINTAGLVGSIAEHIKHSIEKNAHKKIEKLRSEIQQLQSGRSNGSEIFIMPGYVLQREIEAIGKSSFRKIILSKCFELYGKKRAAHKASQILAKMLSYPIIGIAVTLTIGVVILGFGNNMAGMGIMGLGSVLVLVLIYGIYDELSDLVRKRQKSISRQFPNVVSKLALLVTSGMIMDRAWKETAYSQETEMYLEMRKTSKELDNLVSPEVAYGGFISRCNTKETAKLASAIMQNLSKGNAEIGRLLKDMAREAWQERRHIAKRDAEKANSKLMIPTMLLFLAILVMLMVPIAMNFSGL